MHSHTIVNSEPTGAKVPDFIKPEWIRIDDAVRLYSISRSGLYEMVKDGTLKSVVLKKKRNIRGIRLLSTSSLDAMLESLAKESQLQPA